MARPPLDQTPEWRKGIQGEDTVERLLLKWGYDILRLGQIKNRDGIGAPMIMSARCNTISPDYQVMDGEHPPFLVEVKWKKLAPECYKLGHVAVHGIGQRNWNHYLRATEKYAKCPLWLTIVEHETREVLALRLNEAKPDDRDPTDTMQRGGMVYWKKSRFALIARLGWSQPGLPVIGQKDPVRWDPWE